LEPPPPPADERLRWRRGDDGLRYLETDDEAVAVAVAPLSPASKEPDLRGESQLMKPYRRAK
jgi:hypothetical protein